ncbi:MAG: hypothetical protein LBI05_01670 [Planctomycetaceae bacterium]|jgi:hypothetical protein|nr:hypothetical protein [Planctomycetaceae bacterium]
MKNQSTLTLLTVISVSLICIYAAESASAQQTYVLKRVPVIEQIPCTGYKKVVETHYVEEDVTTYETVWETEKKERRYTVARQVPETSYSERRYTVQRPVEETEYRDTSYNVTRMVPETSEREERHLVPRQVTEMQERQVYETRRMPVQETSVEQRVYTVNRPVTNYVGTVVDRGQHVNQVVTTPGQTYERLAWHRANYVDPVTGESKWRIPGFYLTSMQGPARHEVNRVYQPNYVTETVPVTSVVQEQRVEQVPVTRTTYQDEQIVRTEQVPVTRTIQEEVVRRVPVTTYKPIVERVEQTTPVVVRRMVPEEMVERVPVKTYKTITEEKVEPYEVKVAKVVPVTRTVRRPVTTEKWEPYTYTMERKKTEVRRIPVQSVTESIVTETVIDVPQETPVAKPTDDPADKVPTLP